MSGTEVLYEEFMRKNFKMMLLTDYGGKIAVMHHVFKKDLTKLAYVHLSGFSKALPHCNKKGKR